MMHGHSDGSTDTKFDRSLWQVEPTVRLEVEEQFRRALEAYRAQPDLVREHANLEESIRRGGYANRTLLELVQNAADAIGASTLDDVDGGRVEIVLDTTKATLYCANDGAPFTAEGVKAISMAHLSAKRGDEIGRFGLGFKSVLAVSDAPQVFSKSVAFEFNTPEARDRLRDESGQAGRLPVLRLATTTDTEQAVDGDPILRQLCSWATTVVRLPGAGNLDRLRVELEEFSSEFLLFVQSVRQVRLRVIGDKPFDAKHESRSLGEGRFRIETGADDPSEWIVSSRRHTPSPKARQDVGEAVARSAIKVTVAVPANLRVQRRGRFWSYFPLQDETSASALFNAPWSVNDDRTTLLKNGYNQEILAAVAEMFCELLPPLSTADDPAAHLDFMPARGREILSFGDAVLTNEVPRIAAKGKLIPDAAGRLRNGAELTPLDLSFSFDKTIHQAWCESPNTRDDVPHWTCYQGNTRATRLRDLYMLGRNPKAEDARDVLKALTRLPSRGLLTWLREWADGTDMVSAANALRVVAGNPNLPDINQAKVIPTTTGFRSLKDRQVVFLRGDPGLGIQDTAFVVAEFLAQPDVDRLLRDRGFRDLNPEAVLRARLAQLGNNPSLEGLEKVWDAARSVSPKAAAQMMGSARTSVKVPTLDGGWAWPQQVVDIGVDLGDQFAGLLLDRTRCGAEVAHQLGVATGPVREFPLEDEMHETTFREWLVSDLNNLSGPGNPPIESVELNQAAGPGPFSVLLMLRDAGVSDAVRERWTSDLLRFRSSSWAAEDVATRRSFDIVPPALWAVRVAGLVGSSRGLRRPNDVVAPSLLQYEGLLPVFKGSSEVASNLALPDRLGEVPPHVMREMLGADTFPQHLRDAVLAEFVAVAATVGFDSDKPRTIPARVGRAVEACAPASVFLAIDDEQEVFLRGRQRPFLRVSAQSANHFVERVGCRRFEDSFSFSEIVEGRDESQPLLDVYTGLRNRMGAEVLTDIRLARAATIAKRVTTAEGVEDKPQDWLRHGGEIVVRADADQRRVLQFVNEAFELRLDNAQLDDVIKVGLTHQLEALRVQATSVASDAERLEIYIGDDDLREALPSGLWSALAAQGVVDDATSVAKLLLTVYGTDSVRMLADRFRDEGFTDVPTAWAGTPAAITWVRRMGFSAEFAGRRSTYRPQEYVVPGAVRLNDLHPFQKRISERLRAVLTVNSDVGQAQKGLVELPTGAGKTRVATQTMLRLYSDDVVSGVVLWIAQSAELCEQAVQTFDSVWRYLGDERPLSIGRLWGTNDVQRPDTDFGIIVATDAKIEAVMDRQEYEWLRESKAVFIDEAHRAGGSTRYTRILKWLGVDGRNFEKPLVGLSATPFKGSSGETEATRQLAARFGNNLLTAFDADPYQHLVREGVLAAVRHEVLPGVDVSLQPDEQRAIRSSRVIDRGVYERLGRDEARMKILVEHILALHERHPEWPVLAFTPSVLSAQVLAASLRYRGVTSESVSGQTGSQQRRDVIARFQRGDIKVLANCDLLIQGFDAPGVRALYIARPTFSPSAYIQMAGRGLRGWKNGGKEECLVVDVADNWGAENDFLGYRGYTELWNEQRPESDETVLSR